jgi:hypothetical protein
MNYNIKDKHVLQEGEIICPVCKGTGLLDNNEVMKIWNFCTHCMGEKKLTWTEVICGVSKNKFANFTLPLTRVMFPNLVANQIVSVQPMDKPYSVANFMKPKFENKEDELNG